MSKTYDNIGLRFRYPENWEIGEESASSFPLSVSLETPGGGFWSAQVFDTSDPHETTMEILKTMREEYKQLEADSVIETIDPHQLCGFDLHFYCLDLLVSASIRGVTLPGSHPRCLVVMYQAEDREFDRLQPVFAAILIDLLRNQQLAAASEEN